MSIVQLRNQLHSENFQKIDQKFFPPLSHHLNNIIRTISHNLKSTQTLTTDLDAIRTRISNLQSLESCDSSKKAAIAALVWSALYTALLAFAVFASIQFGLSGILLLSSIATVQVVRQLKKDVGLKAVGKGLLTTATFPVLLLMLAYRDYKFCNYLKDLRKELLDRLQIVQDNLSQDHDIIAGAIAKLDEKGTSEARRDFDNLKKFFEIKRT